MAGLSRPPVFRFLPDEGFPTIYDLMGDRETVDRHRNARHVTLRLKSSMHHRCHAPPGRRDHRTGEPADVPAVRRACSAKKAAKASHFTSPPTLVPRAHMAGLSITHRRR